MLTAKTAGRTIAALLLAQMACGPIVNFVLMTPVLAAPGYLENAAAHATELRFAAVLGMAMGAVSIAIALVALPVFRRCSRRMAFAVLAIAVVGLAVSIVENIHLLSMLSLSQGYASAAVADRATLAALRTIVAAPRNWAHYIGLIVSGGFALALYGTLYRFALVPRLLAGAGMLAALLEIVGVGRPLFGYELAFPLLAPLGACHLALVLWLSVKGFAEREPSKQGD